MHGYGRCVRRRNLTRPPDAVALVVIGIVATFVGANAIAVAVAALHLVRWAIGAPVWDAGDDFGAAETALTGALSLALLLVGLLALRKTVALWTRAQDAERPQDSVARWRRER